ncbi:MAG: hypothetical protein IT236_09815, partial [Bacteroidia bacterium]|nr:hypothetical protein [Bacteroidia bacterium]
MKKYGYILILIFFVFGCKKNKNSSTVDPSEPPITIENSAFKCATLPPAPVPFGWKDTTTNVDHNINTFMFNPSNPDEVIIVVNGDMFGYNKMYCYNVRTQSNKYLATLDNFKPSINKYGWIVYSTVDNNIFKIKTNGDSITQLTSNNTTKDPKWDYSGNFIFYFQMA